SLLKQLYKFYCLNPYHLFHLNDYKNLETLFLVLHEYLNHCQLNKLLSLTSPFYNFIAKDKDFFNELISFIKKSLNKFIPLHSQPLTQPVRPPSLLPTSADQVDNHTSSITF